jgi:hypothetical protein
MAKRKTHTPTDPAEIARRRQEERRDPSKWGVSYEAMTLPTNADVGMEEATRTKVQRIQRYDCFALLHVRGALPSDALVAVRRLQDGLACSLRCDGAVSLASTPSGGSRALVSDRSLAASEALRQIAGRMGTLPWNLLSLLIEPEVIHGRPTNWRAVVQGFMGEHRQRQQVEHVIAACKELAQAYRDYDNTPRQKAA